MKVKGGPSSGGHRAKYDLKTLVFLDAQYFGKYPKICPNHKPYKYGKK